MTLEELQGMPKFDTHAHIRGPLGEREREFVALLQTYNLKWLDICVVGTECVDELAKRLDRYPNFAVDTAARIVHFQVQDQKKVRSFILKYQGRLLYGTDNEVGMGGGQSDVPAQLLELETVYRQDYCYFATFQEIEVPQVKGSFKVRGLALTGSVLKKIYFENAKTWYRGI